MPVRTSVGAVASKHSLTKRRRLKFRTETRCQVLPTHSHKAPNHVAGHFPSEGILDRGKRRHDRNRVRLSVRRCVLESALARHRLRNVADRAQGAYPSIGHFARGPRTATIRCRADESPGRRQPGTGRRSTGLAANGEPALHLLRLGPALGRRTSLRSPERWLRP